MNEFRGSHAVLPRSVGVPDLLKGEMGRLFAVLEHIRVLPPAL